ncbi:unnamed protein product [Microthlaspi erraticum]|uniref:Uncharacterized protein n=1 Tax=Microthlaspi erraticum TaxID=1685480 RepID=A0A6D2JRX2_9BRAS|nr:unnamed protein product [Microthlaspi erraticum]
MASAPRRSSVGKDPAKALSDLASGFVENVKRNKHSFFQFFAISGMLLLSFRSISQKYQIHQLEEEMVVLNDERDSLNDRMKQIKSSLLRQATVDSTGVFASRLRLLFSDDDQ